jgi:exopolysaccharide production protein ExoZ
LERRAVLDAQRNGSSLWFVLRVRCCYTLSLFAAVPVSTSVRLYSLQQLRGYAALAVVVMHARLMAADVAVRTGTPDSVSVSPLFGAWGVDLFFVISGFVMTQVVASARATASFEAGAGGFLLRRLGRVVPLYWIATLAMAAAISLLPASARESTLAPWHLLASLLFVPALNWNGEWLPVLVVGWTLTFEMLFYTVIAVALRWRWKMPVEGAAAVLALGALLGLTGRWPMPWGVFTDPLLLEFGLGVGAWWAAQRWSPSRRVLWLCIAAAIIIVLATSTAAGLTWRVGCWGVPAAVVVCALVVRERQAHGVSAEPAAIRWLDMLMLRLGDASYSIYLFHLFAIKIVARLAIAAHFTPGILTTITLETVAIVVSAALGLAVHRVLETPMLAATYRALGRNVLRQAADNPGAKR